MNIGIYIYNQAEILDFSGPFEVFSTARRLGAEDLNVFMVSQHAEPVVARGGFKVLADYSIRNHPEIDLLMVVGGVHTDEMNKRNVLDWLASVSGSASQVASVCTGAFLLAKAGLLEGLAVTTHWEDISELALQFPCLDVISDKRWVTSGKFTTSGGISAGIDMSLHLVSVHYGLQFSSKVARQMEYSWHECT